ncbi:hypothetical protein LC085_12215 [Bacillus tianshenii]|uniref:hypothetical protein n=1 Tax=Sutcliffiella tianshenii TaxID=1463404 RepID=UPI001CD72819|nr:hypothetical protein [Bacillus tianshenii]MCA1320678.1 hypothetical protein [Bacillus tianshenii]
MKISKALDSSYQRLANENSLDGECVERMKAAREEYMKAMLHASFVDESMVHITKG